MYAKLFTSITESSLWSEPKEVRLLFVTMLAKADQDGFVEASIPGLARVANLTIGETEASLKVLMSPDPYSKNPANEGRRIAEIPGGFLLLNYEDYRARRSTEERREYMRQYMQEYRTKKPSRKQSVNSGKQNVNSVSRGKPQLAHTEADTDTEAEAKKKSASAFVRDSFETWWKSYPKKVAKDNAAKAYSAALKKIGGEMHEAAEKLLSQSLPRFEQLRKRDQQYIPHPASWLNSGGWQDELKAIAPDARPVFGPGQNYDPNHDYESEAF